MIKQFFQPPKYDRWDDYFEPGEVLLWQGAPEPGPQSYIGPYLISIFGIPFLLAGLATARTGLGYVFGMNSLGDLGIGLFLSAFSVPFICAGAAMTVGIWLHAFNGHKFVRYALTNKRACVARSFYKHALETYAIGPDDAVTLEQGRFDTVRFKTIHGRDSDGHEVYALIRQIQRDLT